MVRNTTLCSQQAVSGSAPLGGAPPPRRRLLVEMGGFLWLAGELWAADHGGPRETGWSLPYAQEAGAETCTSSAIERRTRQTADEVRKILKQFHRALRGALGKVFTTRKSLLSTCASKTSFTDLITKHATPPDPAPLRATDSDLDEPADNDDEPSVSVLSNFFARRETEGTVVSINHAYTSRSWSPSYRSRKSSSKHEEMASHVREEVKPSDMATPPCMTARGGRPRTAWEREKGRRDLVACLSGVITWSCCQLLLLGPGRRSCRWTSRVPCGACRGRVG